MNRILFLFAFFLVVSCGQKRKQDKNISKLIARVNNHYLTEDSLFLGGVDSIERAFHINSWVERKVFFDEAKNLDLDKDKKFLKLTKDFKEKTLVSMYLQLMTQKNIEISDSKVSEYYLLNKKSFKRTRAEAVVRFYLSKDVKQLKNLKKALKKANYSKNIKIDRELIKSETKKVKEGFINKTLNKVVFINKKKGVLGPYNIDGEYCLINVVKYYPKNSYVGLDLVYDEILNRLKKLKEVGYYKSLKDSLYLVSDVFKSER
tara:strand:+ start:4701 stop:5483 length:783 start_codon:yes stop_codon:yes gene_type:complete